MLDCFITTKASFIIKQDIQLDTLMRVYIYNYIIMYAIARAGTTPVLNQLGFMFCVGVLFDCFITTKASFIVIFYIERIHLCEYISKIIY